MKITGSNSQEISERIGAILNKHVNIMNEKGIIVASTDPSRIRTLHEGAKKLIEKNEVEMDIYPDDNLSGAKNGVNVPIHIEGRTIGVIGVTGNPQELQDIAMVIGEMANIMFMNTQQSMKDASLARRRRLFCEELLLNSRLVINSETLKRAEELSLPIQRVQSIGVFHIPEFISETERLAIDDKLTSLLRTFLGDSVYIHHHHIGQNLAVFFHFRAKSSAVAHINAIIRELSMQKQIHIFCGLSCCVKDPSQIHTAYLYAEKAMEIASHAGISQCLIYENLALEIIISQLSPDSIHAFLENVWKDAEPGQRNQAADFLAVYFDSNGSLDQIAQKLYIHKNTVQYKIKKIIDLTGYDPRLPKDAAVLFLAYKLLNL